MFKKTLSLILSSVLFLSMCACSKKSVQISEDDAKAFAEEYCEALEYADTDSLIDMNISDNKDFIKDLSFWEVTGDSDIDSVYEAWYSTLKLYVTAVNTVDANNIEVSVTINYADNYAFELPSADFASSWIYAISNEPQMYISYSKFSMIYDEGADEFYVSDSTDLVNKATAMFDVDFGVVVPSENNGLAIHIEKNEDYVANDGVQINVTFDDDYGYFVGRSLNVEVTEPNGQTATQVVPSYQFDRPFDITAALFGMYTYSSGIMIVRIYDSNGISGEAEFDVSATTTAGFMSWIYEPYDEAIAGYFDDATGVYINEHMNVQIAFPDGYHQEAPAPGTGGAATQLNLYGGELDCIVLNDGHGDDLVVWTIITVSLDPDNAPHTLENLTNYPIDILNYNGFEFGHLEDVREDGRGDAHTDLFIYTNGVDGLIMIGRTAIVGNNFEGEVIGSISSIS